MDRLEPDPNCPRCAALAARVGELEQRVQELQAALEKLTATSKTTSRNSSKPPSSDPSWQRRRSRSQDGERRKRGAQPGHAKAERELRPPEEVDCVEDVLPTCCSGCGGGLEGHDPNPRRHQVVDLPPIDLLVHEWRLHALTCSGCGSVTRAGLPEAVPRGAFGPNLQALIVLLTGHYRMPRRSAQELLDEVLGLDISIGSISNIEGRVADALAPVHAEILDSIREAETKHLDETSWRQANGKFWLWVAMSDDAAAFLIRDNRSGEVARELLGDDPSGTVVTDRFSGYAWVDTVRRQLCWAHLLRDFQKIADSGGEESLAIGENLKAFGAALFIWFHRYRDGEVPRSEWIARANDFRDEIRQLLERGARLDHWRTPGICSAILKVEPAMWTFVGNDDVEPTNNDAERAIRPAVIWRKVSLGTQSERGSRFVERMLSCTATLRMRGRSVFEYLRQACAASLRGDNAGSLLA